MKNRNRQKDAVHIKKLQNMQNKTFCFGSIYYNSDV